MWQSSGWWEQEHTLFNCRVISYTLFNCRVIFYMLFNFRAISYMLFNCRVISYILCNCRVISYMLFNCRVVFYMLFNCRVISYMLFNCRVIYYMLCNCRVIFYTLFNCRVTSTHYYRICILVLTTLRVTTWMVETYRWSLCKKIITFIHPSVFVGIYKKLYSWLIYGTWNTKPKRNLCTN